MSEIKNRWMLEEIALLRTDMSSEEIAKKTGRTLDAVRMKRYRVAERHMTAKKPHKEFYSAYTLSEAEKIIRISERAKQMGIKLEGEG